RIDVGRCAVHAHGRGGDGTVPPGTAATPRETQGKGRAMNTLTEMLDRTVVIRAEPSVVFRYFTDSVRFAAWWGAGSSIDARPGGAVRIRYPNGVAASGEVVDLVPGKQIRFTYGYDANPAVPPGSTRVTIDLAPHSEGTRLHLHHEFADP